MRVYHFDIYLFPDQFYQSFFLNNRDQKQLQISSDDDILRL